jgi:DNA replication protein DnaC
MNDFSERLKQLAEREAEEKAQWDALPEAEKQRIIAQREQARIQEEREKQISVWENNGIPKRYIYASWENWIADTPGKRNAIDKAKRAWKENLFLAGKNGTGKTYLAMCLTKEGATYRNAEDMFQELRSDFDSEKETLYFYGSRKLLIIDEVGRQNKKELSDFEKNKFFEIINRRWNNCLPTTLIANMDIEEAVDLLGTAILDRLRPIFVPFNWESMRGQQDG